MNLKVLKEIASSCEKCSLCATRKKVVFGRGETAAEVMVVGEAPGEQEDLSGQPFVGRSGNLLTEGLEKAELKRIFISNLVKCRPPENRDPLPEEIQACTPYLLEQIRLIRPLAIIAVGRLSGAFFFGRPIKITKEYGSVEFFFPPNDKELAVPVYLLQHPSYVLRTHSEETKNAFFGVLEKVRREVEEMKRFRK